MRTWQVVVTSWKTTVQSLSLVGFISGCYLLFGLLGLPFANQGAQPTVGQAVLGLVFFCLYCFTWPLIQGGCLAFVDTRLAQPSAAASLGTWWQGAKKLYGRILGLLGLWTLAFLVWGIVFGVVFVVALSMGAASQQETVSILMTVVACIIGGFALYPLIIISAMAPVATAVDGSTVFQAIGKGWKVGRAGLGKLVLVTLALILTLIPAILVNMLPLLLQGAGAPMVMVGRLLGLVTQSLISALSLFLSSCAYIQIYRAYAGLSPASPSSS